MRLRSPAWFLDLTRGTAATGSMSARGTPGRERGSLADACGDPPRAGEREPAADDAVLALHRGLTGVADRVLAWRICGDVRYDTGFYRDAEAAYTEGAAAGSGLCGRVPRPGGVSARRRRPGHHRR